MAGENRKRKSQKIRGKWNKSGRKSEGNEAGGRNWREKENDFVI